MNHQNLLVRNWKTKGAFNIEKKTNIILSSVGFINTAKEVQALKRRRDPMRALSIYNQEKMVQIIIHQLNNLILYFKHLFMLYLFKKFDASYDKQTLLRMIFF